MTEAIAVDAVVVGSGFAGLAMARALLRSGRSRVVVLERSERAGGTWQANRYPGAACDVESFLYSYSFAPNPDWEHLFGRQAEILAYTDRCIDAFGLRDRIETNTRVTRAHWDAGSATWSVHAADGRCWSAPVLIAATGGLSQPVRAAIPGAERFAGDSFHTAEWPAGYSTAGKRVAVVGTGASAIQVVPEVAKDAAQLTVFQRTPPWIIPRHDRPIGPTERAIYRRIPMVQRGYRLAQYAWHEMFAVGFTREPRVMKYGERMALRHLREQVPDPVLRDRLTPRYQVGCKRILLSNDYYPALQRPNVELVTDPIETIEPNGVRTRHGRLVEIDTLVWATGFQASEAMAPFAVTGRDGLTLEAAWSPHPVAYKGTCINGFPNAYLLVGPNTGLGHSSMLLMIEAQVGYVMSCLALAEQLGARAIEVRDDVQAGFNRVLQERMKRTVWATGCTSWYQTASGVNTTLWPGFTFEFMWQLRRAERWEFDRVGD